MTGYAPQPYYYPGSPYVCYPHGYPAPQHSYQHPAQGYQHTPPGFVHGYYPQQYYYAPPPFVPADGTAEHPTQPVEGQYYQMWCDSEGRTFYQCFTHPMAQLQAPRAEEQWPPPERQGSVEKAEISQRADSLNGNEVSEASRQATASEPSEEQSPGDEVPPECINAFDEPPRTALNKDSDSLVPASTTQPPSSMESDVAASSNLGNVIRKNTSDALVVDTSRNMKMETKTSAWTSPLRSPQHASTPRKALLQSPVTAEPSKDKCAVDEGQWITSGRRPRRPSSKIKAKSRRKEPKESRPTRKPLEKQDSVMEATGCGDRSMYDWAVEEGPKPTETVDEVPSEGRPRKVILSDSSDGVLQKRKGRKLKTKPLEDSASHPASSEPVTFEVPDPPEAPATCEPRPPLSESAAMWGAYARQQRGLQTCDAHEMADVRKWYGVTEGQRTPVPLCLADSVVMRALADGRRKLNRCQRDRRLDALHALLEAGEVVHPEEEITLTMKPVPYCKLGFRNRASDCYFLALFQSIVSLPPLFIYFLSWCRPPPPDTYPFHASLYRLCSLLVGWRHDDDPEVLRRRLMDFAADRREDVYGEVIHSEPLNPLEVVPEILTKWHEGIADVDDQHDAEEFYSFLLGALSDEVHWTRSTRDVFHVSTGTSTAKRNTTSLASEDSFVSRIFEAELEEPRGDNARLMDSVSVRRLSLSCSKSCDLLSILESKFARGGSICRLPPVMPFHVHRALFEKQRMVKDNAQIQMSSELVLPPNLLAEHRTCVDLSLRSAVLHIGTSANAGHYVAVLFDDPLNAVIIDDTIVQEIRSPDVSQVYLAFYMRNDVVAIPTDP
ncbi:MAG: hypothetical protein KVP17_003937 [Porospora cf. gigantea B]|uniref:uncharacterized protein n=1 Tax=Porospora cf. gigantea B TaxID=2853592 RepID=UPI0035718E25|nr:MAG: hypothetical protein KVP17_003937 [Porospora cf. gigantea B]